MNTPALRFPATSDLFVPAAAWLIALAALTTTLDAVEPETSLWFDKPATSFHESLPNLFDSCPPFQIDGNFGGCAGIAEVLLQSHAGEVELLPALPKAWPSGSVRGLKARGNFTVDIAWQEGRVTSCRVTASEPRPVKLRVPGATREIQAGRR